MQHKGLISIQTGSCQTRLVTQKTDWFYAAANDLCKHSPAWFRCSWAAIGTIDLILYVPVIIFSVMSGWVFLGWISTKQRIKCLTQEHKAAPPEENCHKHGISKVYLKINLFWSFSILIGNDSQLQHSSSCRCIKRNPLPLEASTVPLSPRSGISKWFWRTELVTLYEKAILNTRTNSNIWFKKRFRT